MEIPNLSEIVTSSLDYFDKNPVPSFDADKYDMPLVVGSGNAFNTGKILFSGRAAVFADESSFRSTVDSYKKIIDSGLVTQAVVISASGGKDSVWETELAKESGLHTTLLTTKGRSDAARVADETIVYKSIPEPYTYNTSTYMGMILSVTGENPAEVKKHLESVVLPEGFADYSSYAFLLPDKFMEICEMLEIKGNELFGPKLSLRAFSQGHARHAKFVIRDKAELAISIGQKNEHFGDPASRWDIELPENADYALIMALTYYIVGRIQDSKPQYFKENIADYVSNSGPKAYGPNAKPFDLIVPGTDTE